jgi:phytoene dehydrogenase-like protein
VTGQMVLSIDELPATRAILCDVTPRQLIGLAKGRLPEGFRRKLEQFRYGPGACKVDWALNAPIPWTAEACRRAGTVHVGGTLEDVAAAELDPWRGEHAERPFVLLAQPTLFDPTRAPDGKHIAWAYCHVPKNSRLDVTDRIERQIERFAPGFRRTILKRSVLLSADLEAHDPNLVGGDISGGAADLDQLFTRPTWRRYRTPSRGLYLCSASTPPGGGVHGLCGYLAARAALKDGF